MPARKREVEGKAKRYGRKHRDIRARWAVKVERGEVWCWRCRQVIVPGQAWDLGHHDYDHRVHMGPEHATCNRAAAARKVNASRKAPVTSRAW